MNTISNFEAQYIPAVYEDDEIVTPGYWFMRAHVSTPYGEYDSPFQSSLPETATEEELKAEILAQFP